MVILSCFQNIFKKIKINIQGGEILDNAMQSNSIPTRIPLNKGLAYLQGFYSKENKKQYVVASLHIKEKEGVQQKYKKIMAAPERNEEVAKHQEESSGENKVGDQGEVAAHFEEEEDPFRVFPGDWWYGSIERNKFFSDLHQKLVYLQGCLPYLRAMEKDPKYVKKGPSSRDVELLMQQYVPEKAADPGSLFLEINFANGYTSQGVTPHI